MSIDIVELATIMRAASQAEIRPRFRRLDPATIHTKSSPTDLVTEGDTAAERVITAEIARRWPAALVIGEEAVAADPALLDRMSDAPLAITLDPIDGTANYAAGLPLFAVMAGVVAKGETVAGILYDPMGDDWMLAERGGGAWLRRPDGASLRLKSADPVPLAQTVAHVSMSFLPKATKPQVLANLSKLSILANYRCAGHDYRTMASGHCHALFFNKLMPWDHVPGALICAEAGAHVARLDGSPYLPHHRDGGLLLAPDAESWSVLRREVFTL